MAEAILATEPIRLLGESIGFWVQTAAFVLSAIAAVWVIKHNGTVARKRATVDLIIHQKSDQKLLDAIRTVYRLSEERVPCTRYLSDVASPEYQAILFTLNNHEFIALGIRQKAFEEKIYKELQYSNFVKLWDAAAGFVEEIRQQDKRDTLFQEFEWLAKRWKASPLKRKSLR